MTHVPASRIDDELRAELTTTLAERRETLVRQLEQLSHELPGVATDGDAQPNDAQISLLRHDQITVAIRDADRALEALADPDFGSCASCSETIAADRLRALPDTTLCATCATHPSPGLVDQDILVQDSGQKTLRVP